MARFRELSNREDLSKWGVAYRKHPAIEKDSSSRIQFPSVAHYSDQGVETARFRVSVLPLLLYLLPGLSPFGALRSTRLPPDLVGIPDGPRPILHDLQQNLNDRYSLVVVDERI